MPPLFGYRLLRFSYILDKKISRNNLFAYRFPRLRIYKSFHAARSGVHQLILDTKLIKMSLMWKNVS